MPGIESGLTDIALRGLEAARHLVDRFVDAVDHADAPPLAEGADDAAARPSDRATQEVAELWAALLRTTTAAWQGVAPGTGPAPTAPLVAGHPGTVVPLRVPAGATTAATELWLHNPTSEPVLDARVVAGSLLGGDGQVVADAVTVDPGVLDRVPERASRPVAVSVHLPPGAPAGRYRGLVLVDGIADTWAVLDVEIGGPA